MPQTIPLKLSNLFKLAPEVQDNSIIRCDDKIAFRELCEPIKELTFQKINELFARRPKSSLESPIASLSDLISFFPNLEKLILSPGANEFIKLDSTHLDIHSCPKLKEVRIENMDLKHVAIYGDMPEIHLQNLGSLTSLEVGECKSLHLQGLKRLGTIKPQDNFSESFDKLMSSDIDKDDEFRLSIGNCQSLHLEDMPQLSKLDLSTNTQLENLYLRSLPSLSNLDVSTCDRLKEVVLQEHIRYSYDVPYSQCSRMIKNCKFPPLRWDFVQTDGYEPKVTIRPTLPARAAPAIIAIAEPKEPIYVGSLQPVKTLSSVPCKEHKQGFWKNLWLSIMQLLYHFFC